MRPPPPRATLFPYTTLFRSVRDHGPFTAPLFADDEQQSDARVSGRAEALGGRDLHGQDPFRVAGAASVQDAVCLAAREERRHAVVVRGEHDVRRLERGEDVEAVAGDRLLNDPVAEPAQPRRQPPAGVPFPTRGRVDVDQLARERDGCQRIHSSRAVLALVRSSRYFTMTGAATESPQSFPGPDWIGRVPGTTTAPSGTTSGSPGAARMIVPVVRSYSGVDAVRIVPAARTARFLMTAPS